MSPPSLVMDLKNLNVGEVGGIRGGGGEMTKFHTYKKGKIPKICNYTFLPLKDKASGVFKTVCIAFRILFPYCYIFAKRHNPII